MGDERRNGLPTRVLGATGERVTVIGVGGFHIGRARDAALGVRIVREAIDEGVNFLDNAWCYNRGESERIMGEALRGGYRERAFLMTKNHGRDGETYRRQLEESLRRLETDVIDLVQFHDIREDAEPGRIAAEGALEAAIRARDEGKIRYVGFTGHLHPDLHRRMLELDFPWDTVQLPVNLLDRAHLSFSEGIVPILRQRGIGVIGMKSLAGGRIVERTDVSARQAISYALSEPIDTLVTGIDSLDVLRQNLEIARSWVPMADDERTQLLRRTADVAATGSLEYYKQHA